MKGMLGKQFPILGVYGDNDDDYEITHYGVIALPSPDGSQNGKWYFSKTVVEKVPGKQTNV